MTQDSPYDAIVVGARCAGAATAMLLARAGLRVALLDRSGLGSDTLSTHALMRTGVLQLDRWGLLDGVIDAGTPPVRRTIFRYGDAATTVTLKPLRGVDALYAPRRTVIDRILVEAARDAGVRVLLGTTVTDVLRDTGGRVTGVTGHDAVGRSISLGSTVTVGADGMSSRVARCVEAPVERSARNAAAFIYGYVAGVNVGAYEWFYRPGVTAGVIPTNGGEACVWAGTPPARFRDELAFDVRGGFARLLAQASPELAERVAARPAPARLRSFPGIAGFVRRPWGPGWALVGDSGYYKDPITAHGMSDAFRDAELVSRSIIACHDGEPEAEAMGRYHATRNFLSEALFDVTDTIASYQWDTVTVEGHLRQLSAAMAAEVEHLMALDTPPLVATSVNLTG